MNKTSPISMPNVIVLVMLVFSCNTASQQVKQKDSAKTDTVGSPAVSGDNEVKSEAPDAVTQTEQGYAMPRYNEGKFQSPVNILTDSTQQVSSREISIRFITTFAAVENLGHTVQLDFREGSTTLAGDKTYSSRQIHFHTPSEHLIDGMTFPMEIHIVNVLKDSGMRHSPQYMVIGVLFKMGHESKFIKEFLKTIPREEGKESLPPGAVQIEDLFNTIAPDEPAGYYSYNGSLTTPPYSESVNWIIRKCILEASPEQIHIIEKLEGDNARHVHALYARKVVSH